MGGKFGHGFWSAGVGAALGGQISAIKTAVGRVVASAVVGGTISKLTGGKFANGAFGAAFARVLGEARQDKETYLLKKIMQVKRDFKRKQILLKEIWRILMKQNNMLMKLMIIC